MTTPAPASATAAPATTTPSAPAATPKPPKVLRESAIIPILMVGFGGYLLWFGVKYWRGAGAATWPSYPLKSVLQGKGIPPNTPAPSPEAELATAEAGGGGSGSVAGYVNPFAGVSGLTPERVDQGVDFGGTGPVGAIGPGVVTYADQGGQTGWPGLGGFIRYKLTGGPAAGKEVYVAENVTPSVTAGQKVTAGQQLGTISPGGIETGWAIPEGTATLSSTPQAGEIGGGGPFPTQVGVNFDRLLVALGVAPAPNVSQLASGKLPAGYPESWGTGSVGGKRGKVTVRETYVAFRNAGIGRGAAIWLTAIAGVESGYDTNALNTNASTGDYSVGLTQINYFGPLYSERAPYIGTPKQLLAGGLDDQAHATAWLYNQAGGLGPWEPDITSGKAQKFLPGAMKAAQGGP